MDLLDLSQFIDDEMILYGFVTEMPLCHFVQMVLTLIIDGYIEINLCYDV